MPEITDVEAYAVFDLEPPKADEPEAAAEEPEGAKEQEVAEPDNAGGKEQEVAEPDEADEEELPEEKPTQTREQRAAAAKQRREAERAAAIEDALKKEREANDAKMKKFFERAQMKDPKTGKPIMSLEEFDQWAERDQDERIEKNLRAGKLTRQDIEAIVKSSKTEEQQQKPQEPAVSAAFQMQVDAEMAEIKRLDPTVNSLKDIIEKPTGRRFAELVNKNGMTYLDAFKLANMETLMQRQTAGAAEAARMANASKNHMKATAPIGEGEIEIPRDVLDSYRMINPGMTDKQIREDYQRRMKRS